MICKCMQEYGHLLGITCGKNIIDAINKYKFKRCPYCGYKYKTYELEKKVVFYAQVNRDLTYIIQEEDSGYRNINKVTYAVCGWLNYCVTTKTKEEAIKIILKFTKEIIDNGEWGSSYYLHNFENQ